MADERHAGTGPEADRKEAEQSREESGQRIGGRSFAGASFAADQGEQTDDRRGEGGAHRADDAVDPGRRGSAPADES